MGATKKGCKSPCPAAPSSKKHATRASAVALAASDPAVVSSPSPSTKARTCRTCHGPMKGHNKTACALSKNSPAALEAKVAAAEEAVLAEHTDFVSRRIDQVVALAIEMDEEADSAALMAALADAGLTIPEGKTLADFVPAGLGVDSDDEDDVQGDVDSSAGTPSGDFGSRDVTPAPAGTASSGAEALATPPATPRPVDSVVDGSGDRVRATSADDPMVVDGSAPVLTPPAAAPPTSPPSAAPLVKVVVKTKAPKYRLKYGWKATPSGILPMELERNGLKRHEYPTQAEKAKRIPRMFQAMAQKGDTLASRTGGWAFCVFLPRGGAGIMRSWHSQQVETDVLGLMSDVRRLVFDKLQPFREQYLKSLEEANKKAKLEADFWKARTEEREKENAELRRQLGITEA